MALNLAQKLINAHLLDGSAHPGAEIALSSPETATASALTGVITDPRTLGMAYPKVTAPERWIANDAMLVPPLSLEEARAVRLEKTPLIATLPELDAFPNAITVPVLLKLGDDISTDDIIPAGARVMPYWSNIEKTAEFAFEPIDNTYPARAAEGGGHAIVAGNNYGQGSSRENAAFAPRYLGLRLVIARSFARIHWQNLANFGVLPLTFTDPADDERIDQGEMIHIEGIREALHAGGHDLAARIGPRTIALRHDLSPRQIEILLAGGIINWLRSRLGTRAASAPPKPTAALANPG